MPLRRIGAEKARRIVAAEMPKVVCVRSLVPKEKNSARLGDLAGHQRRARQFDHGADLIVDLGAGLRRDRLPPSRRCAP